MNDEVSTLEVRREGSHIQGTLCEKQCNKENKDHT